MYQLDANKFASSWYIFLTYIYDARSHLYPVQMSRSQLMTNTSGCCYSL